MRTGASAVTLRSGKSGMASSRSSKFNLGSGFKVMSGGLLKKKWFQDLMMGPNEFEELCKEATRRCLENQQQSTKMYEKIFSTLKKKHQNHMMSEKDSMTQGSPDKQTYESPNTDIEDSYLKNTTTDNATRKRLGTVGMTNQVLNDWLTPQMLL